MEAIVAEVPILKLRKIYMCFAKPSGEPFPVLADIDVSLREGEILGLLGRSGSGKSTLLRIAGGLIKPTSGEVLYHGAPLHGPAEGIAVAPGGGDSASHIIGEDSRQDDLAPPAPRSYAKTRGGFPEIAGEGARAGNDIE